VMRQHSMHLFYVVSGVEGYADSADLRFIDYIQQKHTHTHDRTPLKG
jgi:hypothetical protein